MTMPSPGASADRKRKARGLALLAAFALLILLLGWRLGRPLMELIRDKDGFRVWIEASGGLKYFVMIGLMMLQVVIAVIPGGPIEVASGYAFGPLLGSALCLVGSALASAAIFLLTRSFGMRLVRVFVTKKQLDSVGILRDRRKLHGTLAVVFLIPGLPKDMLTYLAGVTPVSLSAFLLISTAARFPSILVSAMGGHWLEAEEYWAGALLLAALLAVTLAASLLYRRHENRRKTTQAPGPGGQGETGKGDGGSAPGRPDGG